jgi:prevent-host-death family protein
VSTYSLTDVCDNLRSVVEVVAGTGEEAIITDRGMEVAVIISMTDYERLHEHADAVDVLRPRRPGERHVNDIDQTQYDKLAAWAGSDDRDIHPDRALHGAKAAETSRELLRRAGGRPSIDPAHDVDGPATGATAATT